MYSEPTSVHVLYMKPFLMYMYMYMYMEVQYTCTCHVHCKCTCTCNTKCYRREGRRWETFLKKKWLAR